MNLEVSSSRSITHKTSLNLVLEFEIELRLQHGRSIGRRNIQVFSVRGD